MIRRRSVIWSPESQSTLGWLLRNWAAISEKVLDPPFEDGDPAEANKETRGDPKIDPRPLSPIDLRSSVDSSPLTRPRPESTPSPASTQAVKTLMSIDVTRDSSASPSTTAFSDTAEAGSACLPISASASGTGIFARAFSSMSFSTDAKVSPVAEAERELYELEQFGEERRGFDGEEWT